MSNTQQNNIQNEIEQIKKKNLLQDSLKKNKKSQNQFQNGLMDIKNTSIKKTKNRSFSNQKNTKYTEEYIVK